MDLFDVARTCIRRWYIVLPLLVITGWFSYGTYSSAKPVYYSNAVIGLAPPSVRVDQPSAGAEVRRNGLLDVGGATLVANMVALGLREPTVVSQVVASGGLPNYNAKMFPTPATAPPIPLIMIDATDADPATVTKTLELVANQADVALRSLQQQARVPEDQMVAPFPVQPPSTPTMGMPSRTRSTISMFAAGVVGAVVVTVLVDVLLAHRKRRGVRRPPTEPRPDTDRPPGVNSFPHPFADAEGAAESR